MGKVYAAEHEVLGRQAAIKVLHPQRSRSVEAIERFFQEARAASAVKHPGIVKVYEVGEAPEQGENGASLAFLVMERLSGESLESRLARIGALSVRAAVRFAVQIASALQAAAKDGIVHRDLKPGNLFIIPDPQVTGGERIKILDFGIAKVQNGRGALSASSKTRGDMLLGSPTYMSPEQCRKADSVDQRADLYSLGCIFFEMLTGRPPFVHRNPTVVLLAHQNHPPPPLRTLVPELDSRLEYIVARLLAKNPDERFASAGELMQAMAQARASAPTTGLDSRLTTRIISRLSTGLTAVLGTALERVGKGGARRLADRSQTAKTAAIAAPRRSRVALVALVALVAMAGVLAALYLLRGASDSPAKSSRSASPREPLSGSSQPVKTPPPKPQPRIRLLDEATLAVGADVELINPVATDGIAVTWGAFSDQPEDPYGCDGCDGCDR